MFRQPTRFTIGGECIRAGRTFIRRTAPRAGAGLHYGFSTIFVTVCTKPMRWFGAAHFWFKHVSDCAPNDVLKLVFLLLSIPCFKASHFFFKLAYAVQQSQLRLVCRKDFFLKFYDRPISNGGIVDVLQSLRHIQHGLECANASEYLGNHNCAPNVTRHHLG